MGDGIVIVPGRQIPDNDNEEITVRYDNNSKNVLSKSTGEFISPAALTLSADSQSLPTPPVGAAHALLQLQGGTVTDVAYISLDGTAAVSTDYVLRNVQDSGCADAALLVGSTLTDIRVLGTAGASTLVIWWFK